MSPILITALICALVQLVLHWFPWRMLLGSDLHRVAAYMLGVLGFALPLTALYWHVGMDGWMHIVALWACVLSSGLAVLSGYGLDWVVSRVRSSYEHEELIDAKAGRE